jgi:hypothetical protein
MMSAAVWAKAYEPYDPHQRLRSIRVGPATGTASSRDSARLLVWGATDDDRAAAEASARSDSRLYRYRIVEVEQAQEAASSTGACGEIARDVRYGRTWIAFRT